MKILKVSDNPPLILEEAVRVLKNGGVVVVPTDTVYGLAADVTNKKAVRKIFEIKGREEDKKLPVLVSSFEMLNDIVDIQDERVLNFLKKAWLAPPKLRGEGGAGKITCVLPRKNGETVGIRMPDYDLVLSIIEKFGGPVTGTSANVTGRPEHTKIDELVAELKSLKVKPDLILDAGDLPPSKPSTVLDCTIWPPKILREGAVSKEELEKLVK